MSNMKTFKETYNSIISEENDSIELKFSPNLASEFTHTVNEFTTVCAKMVKERNISKDLSDKFDDLHTKIKNLVDAAKNS